MNTLTKYKPFLSGLVLLVAALLLSACSDAQPIAVFVTPTPVVEPSSTPSPVAVAAQPAQSAITPLPTPQPAPPGVTYGPIVGPNYTPEPRYTALPTTLHPRPCTLQVTVDQQAVYAAPDLSAAVVDSAVLYDRLTIGQFSVDAAGTRWASTAKGWLPLTVDGAATADVPAMRACNILEGTTPNTTLAGLHVLSGTSDQEVLTFVQRMRDAGYPVGTIKGLNGTENLLNEIERISPETITVYRSYLNDYDNGDCPTGYNETPDAVTTARDWMAGLKPYWDQVNADYYEVINECPVPVDWLTDLMVEAMKIANQEGRCLLLYSFPGGNPDMGVVDSMLPAYQYAAENPCQPGRTHGIAFHSYSVTDDTLASESDKWVVFRYRFVRERMLEVLPEAADLPVIITEMGIGGGTIPPGCDRVIQDVLKFTYQVEEDPYVLGFETWSVGQGGQWYDITSCLPGLADALIDYYASSG